MSDSAVTHWTRDELGSTHGSIDILPEDIQAATRSFVAQEHREPTTAEKRGRAFHERELDVAQNRYNTEIESAVAAHPSPVDAVTLKALLVQESALDPHPRGEGERYQGIAQLGPQEATVNGHTIDRHDPAEAIDAAARTLRGKDRALERTSYATFGTPDAAERTKFTLAAYNGGEGTVEKAMQIAHDDGLALAEKRGLGHDAAERFARDYALHFDNLTEPKGDPSRSPLYRTAEEKLPNSDPLEKYHEIGNYADRIAQRAALEPRTPEHDRHAADAPAHANSEPGRPATAPTLPATAPIREAPAGAESRDQALVNGRIVEAAKALTGMSTRDAQTHDSSLGDGNVACAYAVNQILDVGLGRTYGTNEKSVMSVMTDVLHHGHEVPPDQVRPGDIAIKLPGRNERHGHIGVVMDDGKILSNSSPHASLTSEQDAKAFAHNKHEPSGEDRMVYVRIDPASVDLEHVRSHPVPPRSQLLDENKTPPHVGSWSEHRPTAGRSEAASRGTSEHAKPEHAAAARVAPEHPAQAHAETTHAAAAPVRDARAQTDPTDQALVNGRIVEAAEALTGMSTRNAQTHDTALGDGNVACAYAVNQILDVGLGRTYGANEKSVMSVLSDVRQHGHEVAPGDVRPGDIAIKFPGRGEANGHIGVVMDDGKILSNSSSHASLTSHQNAKDFAHNGKEPSREDRVVYVRIDPASVDLGYVRSHPVPPRSQLLDEQNAPPHVGGWSQHRPNAERSTSAPAHAASASRPLTDANHPHDAVIHGESRDGKIVENARELVEKNDVMREAIRDAKAGKILDFRFGGSPNESAREVARQDEKLAHAIAANLPADAKPEHVAPSAELTWEIGMPNAEFAKLLAQARGGSPNVAKPAQEPARAVPQRGIDGGR